MIASSVWVELHDCAPNAQLIRGCMLGDEFASLATTQTNGNAPVWFVGRVHYHVGVEAVGLTAGVGAVAHFGAFLRAWRMATMAFSMSFTRASVTLVAP